MLFQFAYNQKRARCALEAWDRHRRNFAALGAVAKNELPEWHLAKDAIRIRIASVTSSPIVGGALDIRIAEAILEPEVLHSPTLPVHDKEGGVLVRRQLCTPMRAHAL